jgi:hypothetical protein
MSQDYLSQRTIAENYICDMLYELEKDRLIIEGCPTPSQFKALVDIVERCIYEKPKGRQHFNDRRPKN